MFSLSNLCFLCLGTYKNLKPVLTENIEGLLVLKKLKYCLPELDVDFHSDIRKYICNNCTSKIESLWKFKQTCLRNNTYLKTFFQTLTSSNEPNKHLSVKLTDVQYQNILQAVTSYQTLTSDELRNREMENNRTCIHKTEAVIKSETKCDDDIQKTHSLYEEKNEIVVKEEVLTSEDNVNDEFYHEFVKSIKCDSIPSVSSIDDSKYCGSSIEHNSAIFKEKEDTGKSNINITKIHHCETCIKEYPHKISLDYHVKNHAGIKDFSCAICKEESLDKSNKMEDENFHTGIKNFECSICKRKFMKKGSLIRHEKTHRCIKNFECTICKKKFTTKYSLATHMKLHTGVKNFECSICKKKFREEKSLINHEQRDTCTKIYECSVCKEKFGDESYLIRHEKISCIETNVQ